MSALELRCVVQHPQLPHPQPQRLMLSSLPRPVPEVLSALAAAGLTLEIVIVGHTRRW